MSRKYPSDQRGRTVRMIMDCLEEYPSPAAAGGAETLRKWTVQAQVDMTPNGESRRVDDFWRAEWITGIGAPGWGV